jgi:predicted SnoaL-like aldol condensation-catalyzing enzyme
METIERNKAMVYRFNKEFVEAGTVAVFEEMVAMDFLYHAQFEGEVQGRNAYWSFFQETLRPAVRNLKVTLHDMVAEGEKVMTIKTYSGSLIQDEEEGSDAAVEIDVTEIIRLSQGKFVECWNIMSSHEMGVPSLLDEHSIY